VSACSCGRPKARDGFIACPQCWMLVPLPLRKRVWTLYHLAPGSDDHRTAVRESLQAIREAREPVTKGES
jgi:hypothetical protein